MLENLSPYAVGAHRHAPEIAQQLGFPVCFVPHLLPVRRGLLATCYVQTDADVRALLEDAYAASAVVRVLPDGVAPELARVQGTDAAEIGVFADGATGTAIVICALDNLGKGAAGQAVQNANLALGLDETAGLRLTRSARMSVTAAKGFVASGVHAGIRREKKDLAIVRSIAAGDRRGDVDAEPRAGRAGRRVEARTSTRAEPQAVVINSGVANAATGAQGDADAIATAEHAAGLLGLAPEQVLVLSTGVIGAPLPMDRCSPGVDAAAAALSPDGGDDAAEAIMTTDTQAEGSRSSHGDGFTVGGMAKGSGMIHPDLATMLAVVTTDYPLEPGEAIEFLRPAVEASFNAISVDGECSTNDAVILLAYGAAASSGRPRPTRRSRSRCARVCADLVAPDRRRRRRRDGARRDQRRRRRRRGAGEGDRAAHRDLAARQDRALRPRRELGPRADGRRQRAVQRRLRARRPRRAITLSLQRHRRARRRARRSTSSRRSTAPSARSTLDLGLGDGTAGYLTSDLSYDYVRINADYRS